MVGATQICHVDKVVEEPEIHLPEVIRRMSRTQAKEVVKEAPNAQAQPAEGLVEVPQVAAAETKEAAPQ
eukprot:9210153-Lingulodinium_polyedra.AAC.1